MYVRTRATAKSNSPILTKFRMLDLYGVYAHRQHFFAKSFPVFINIYSCFNTTKLCLKIISKILTTNVEYFTMKNPTFAL